MDLLSAFFITLMITSVVAVLILGVAYLCNYKKIKDTLEDRDKIIRDAMSLNRSDIQHINNILTMFDEYGPNKLENSKLIHEQYKQSLENNAGTELDGLACVFFVDRVTDPSVVQIRGIWFDSNGVRVDRPEEKINLIKHKETLKGEEK